MQTDVGHVAMTLRHGQRVSLIHPDGTVCIVEPTPKQVGKCHIVIIAPKEVRIERDKESVDEIEQLRKERDEARRELCRWSSFYYEEHSDVTAGRPRKRDLEEAERRGWECFKKEQ